MHHRKRKSFAIMLTCFAWAAVAKADFPVITPSSHAARQIQRVRMSPAGNHAGLGVMANHGTIKNGPLAAPMPLIGASQPPIDIQHPSQVANPFVYSRIPPRQQQTNQFRGTAQFSTFRPAHAGEHLAQALRFESQNNIRMAIHAYHRALECDSTNRIALVSFGRMKHRIGDLDGAIVTYRQSLKHHPNDAIALNDLGLCYARNGEVRKALQSLTAASRLAPENKRYSNNLAAVLVEDGKLQQALTCLEDAHGPAIAHFNVAMMLKQRDHRPEAEFHVKEALRLDPSLAPAQQLLGTLVRTNTEPRVASIQDPARGTAALAMGQVAPEPQAGAMSSVADPELPVTVSGQESTEAQVERAHWNFLKGRSANEPLVE